MWTIALEKYWKHYLVNEQFEYRRLAFIMTPSWLAFVFVHSRLGVAPAVLMLVISCIATTHFWKKLGNL